MSSKVGTQTRAQRTSTAPAPPSPGWDRFDRWLRAFAMAAMFAVVGAAVFGVAGLRSGTASGANDHLEVEVTYAKVTRPGLATPFRIAIVASPTRLLPGEVIVSIGNDYLSMFDENGLDPEPDSVSFDGDTVSWTYLTEGQPVLVIDFDARLQPDVHRGRDTTVTVSAHGTDPVVVKLHTTVFG